MNHLKAINTKAARVERATEHDVVGLQRTGLPQLPHFPVGCSLVFSPGWEADRAGGTAGLCQPVERDLFDCHIGCYWPARGQHPLEVRVGLLKAAERNDSVVGPVLMATAAVAAGIMSWLAQPPIAPNPVRPELWEQQAREYPPTSVLLINIKPAPPK